jgi:pimeloyl-ACP methyl ester carboxylesterase
MTVTAEMAHRQKTSAGAPRSTPATMTETNPQDAASPATTRFQRFRRTAPDANERRSTVPRVISARRVVLALLLLAPLLALALRPGVEAQQQTVVVMSTTLRTPFLSWTVRQLTDKPRVEDIEVAGSPATLARPGGGDGPWPAILFVNGATRLGRREPEVQDLARGLARAGYLVVVPDLKGLQDGELTDATVAATVSAARAVADRPDVRGGDVGLVGVSLGGTLALLVAEKDALAHRVSVVSAITPYTDLKEVIRLATTGYRRQGNLLIPRPTAPYVSLVVARSLAAALPVSDFQRRLLAELKAVDDDDPDPLAALRALPVASVPTEAQPVFELVTNRDPRLFDRLYAALPAELKAGVARLSPITRARRLAMPVELISPPQDEYFPVSQSQALVAAAPDARLTVTKAFSHVLPQPSLSHPRDLLRLDGWVVRSLKAAAG